MPDEKEKQPNLQNPEMKGEEKEKSAKQQNPEKAEKKEKQQNVEKAAKKEKQEKQPREGKEQPQEKDGKKPVEKKEYPKVEARLQKLYKERITADLQKQLGYENKHSVPRLAKIVINAGIGKLIDYKSKTPRKDLVKQIVMRDLATITGQTPMITRARKAVSAFQLKRGYEVGAVVTLRRKRMYEFLDRFLNTAVPRIRDFRGFPIDSFDRNGNYTLGIRDHTMFPEIEAAKSELTFGFNVTFCINCKKREDAVALLKAFNFPFRRD